VRGTKQNAKRGAKPREKSLREVIQSTACCLNEIGAALKTLRMGTGMGEGSCLKKSKSVNSSSKSENRTGKMDVGGSKRCSPGNEAQIPLGRADSSEKAEPEEPTWTGQSLLRKTRTFTGARSLSTHRATPQGERDQTKKTRLFPPAPKQQSKKKGRNKRLQNGGGGGGGGVRKINYIKGSAIQITPS